jgi:hypothetical protein
MAKFQKTMQDPFTHEVIAFGWTAKQQQSYTVRDAIAYAQTDINLQNECLELFGADFQTVVAALIKYADLDKEYRAENVFGELEAAE